MVGLRSLRSLVPPYDNRPVRTLQFSCRRSLPLLSEEISVKGPTIPSLVNSVVCISFLFVCFVAPSTFVLPTLTLTQAAVSLQFPHILP